MDAARRETLKALLEQALALPPGERAAFLDRACGDDTALRAELDSLLAHHDEEPDYLDRLAEAALPTALRRDALGPASVRGTGPDPLVGRTISHFQIKEKLGGGGMGIVYKAQDTKLDRTVALKFLPPHLSLDEAAKQRFVHEAKAASALDHPNLCTIHEIGEHAGRLFIAMAYYAGETLKAKIAWGPLPVEEAVDYALQMAEGLRRAHEAGIVHRDIKPANVMVTEEGLVKIVDFGLAKVADVSLTQTGTTLGTVVRRRPRPASAPVSSHDA